MWQGHKDFALGREGWWDLDVYQADKIRGELLRQREEDVQSFGITNKPIALMLSEVTEHSHSKNLKEERGFGDRLWEETGKASGRPLMKDWSTLKSASCYPNDF